MTGKRVKEILKERGYKLASVAESMGIIPQNLQSLLNVDDIKTGVLERIADAINENVLIFFGDCSLKASAPASVAPQQPEGNITMLMEYLREKDRSIEALIEEATKYRTLYERCMGLEKAHTMPDLGAHDATISETAIYPPPLNSASPKPRKSRIKGQSEK